MGFLTNLGRRLKAAADMMLGPDDAAFLTTLSGKHVPPREMYVPPPLPDGLPPFMGTEQRDSGGEIHRASYGVAWVPKAPRWDTYDEARRYAWECHWADEHGAKAMAEHEAATRKQ